MSASELAKLAQAAQQTARSVEQGDETILTLDDDDDDEVLIGGASEHESLEDQGHGVCVRRRYGKTTTYGKVVLREYDGIDIDGAVIVDGFPASTVTAVIAAGYLADHLKLPVIAEFTSTAFPSVCVVEKAQPLNAVRMVGNKNIVVLLSEFKVVDPEITQDLVDAVLDFAHRHGCSNLFTLEGVPKEVLAKVLQDRAAERKEAEAKAAAKAEAKAAEKAAVASAPGAGEDESKSPPAKQEEEAKTATKQKKKKRRGMGGLQLEEDDPTASMSEAELTKLMATLMYLTTHEETATKLKKLGHIPLRNAVVNGTTGRFLSNINLTDVEVTCLLAPTHSRLPDALSGVAIVQCLDELLTHVQIDLGPLKKKAESLEESVGQLRAMLEAQQRPRAAPQGLYS